MSYMFPEDHYAHARRLDAATKETREEEYRHHRAHLTRIERHMDLVASHIERQTAAFEAIARHLAPVRAEPATSPGTAPASTDSAEGWTGNKCPRCNGVGEVQSAHSDSVCPACSGTGDEYAKRTASAPKDGTGNRIAACIESLCKVGDGYTEHDHKCDRLKWLLDAAEQRGRASRDGVGLSADAVEALREWRALSLDRRGLVLDSVGDISVVTEDLLRALASDADGGK